MYTERSTDLRLNPILKDLDEVSFLSEKYDIPRQDIVLTSLNLSGVSSDIPESRVRFRFTPEGVKKDFYFAICVNTIPSTFELKNQAIFLSGEKIGDTSSIENDTCNDNYFRRNGTELTLNTNSRSSCKGCAICGTYSLEADDKERLLRKTLLSQRVKEIMNQHQQNDCSNLYRVTVCTGCFGNEKVTVNHILDLNDVLKDLNFHGTLRYIGSEVTTEEALDKIADKVDRFALSFSVETFTRRTELLRNIKSKVSFEDIKNTLEKSAKRGIETNILYVLGLDPLRDFEEGFKELRPLMNHFPVVNLFQIYSPEQALLRTSEANGIEYYLAARKILEEMYVGSDLRPESWENYRPLWYLSFGKEAKNDIRI